MDIAVTYRDGTKINPKEIREPHSSRDWNVYSYLVEIAKKEHPPILDGTKAFKIWWNNKFQCTIENSSPYCQQRFLQAEKILAKEEWLYPSIRHGSLGVANKPLFEQFYGSTPTDYIGGEDTKDGDYHPADIHINDSKTIMDFYTKKTKVIELMTSSSTGEITTIPVMEVDPTIRVSGPPNEPKITRVYAPILQKSPLQNPFMMVQESQVIQANDGGDEIMVDLADYLNLPQPDDLFIEVPLPTENSRENISFIGSMYVYEYLKNRCIGLNRDVYIQDIFYGLLDIPDRIAWKETIFTNLICSVINEEEFVNELIDRWKYSIEVEINEEVLLYQIGKYNETERDMFTDHFNKVLIQLRQWAREIAILFTDYGANRNDFEGLHGNRITYFIRLLAHEMLPSISGINLQWIEKQHKRNVITQIKEYGHKVVQLFRPDLEAYLYNMYYIKYYFQPEIFESKEEEIVNVPIEDIYFLDLLTEVRLYNRPYYPQRVSLTRMTRGAMVPEAHSTAYYNTYICIMQSLVLEMLMMEMNKEYTVQVLPRACLNNLPYPNHIDSNINTTHKHQDRYMTIYDQLNVKWKNMVSKKENMFEYGTTFLEGWINIGLEPQVLYLSTENKYYIQWVPGFHCVLYNHLLQVDTRQPQPTTGICWKRVNIALQIVPRTETFSPFWDVTSIPWNSQWKGKYNNKIRIGSIPDDWTGSTFSPMRTFANKGQGVDNSTFYNILPDYVIPTYGCFEGENIAMKEVTRKGKNKQWKKNLPPLGMISSFAQFIFGSYIHLIPKNIPSFKDPMYSHWSVIPNLYISRRKNKNPKPSVYQYPPILEQKEGEGTETTISGLGMEEDRLSTITNSTFREMVKDITFYNNSKNEYSFSDTESLL